MELSDVRTEVPTVAANVSNVGEGDVHISTVSHTEGGPPSASQSPSNGQGSNTTRHRSSYGSTGKPGLNDDKKGVDEKDSEVSKSPRQMGLLDAIDRLEDAANKNSHHFIQCFKVCLLIGYFVYFGFAVAHHVGDEGSYRLIVSTIIGVLLIVWNLVKGTKCHAGLFERIDSFGEWYSGGKKSVVIRWVLYTAMTLFMTIYTIVAVAIKTPQNMWSLLGLAVFLLFLFLISKNKRKVNWHTVFWAMSIQFVMALIILKTSWGASVIQWCGSRLEEFVETGTAGSIFIFGEKYMDHPFAFKSMVQAMVLIVGMSVITYLGVISFIVETVGRALAKALDTSPAEGINAVGNIFLHVPESAMLIQQYLADMTPSQLFMTYAGGLSTVGGVALVIFMSSGVSAAPLVAASAMSAPAALAAAKLAFPSTDDEIAPVPTDSEDKQHTSKFLRPATSLMDSIILGINQAVVLVVQAISFIMVFVIILEFINNTSVWFGDRIGVENMTVEYLLSYLFYPMAWLMGTRAEDCLFVGKLLGVRTFSLAVVAYPMLGPIIVNGETFRAYVAASANNTWSYSGEDIILHGTNQTLVGGVIDERSEIIATYALCGSASFAIMGLIIGSFEVIVPHRIGEITQHILLAMVVGTLASYFTACFAGLLFEESIGY